MVALIPSKIMAKLNMTSEILAIKSGFTHKYIVYCLNNDQLPPEATVVLEKELSQLIGKAFIKSILSPKKNLVSLGSQTNLVH